MNNNIDSFRTKSEEINSKINRIEEDYQKNIVDQKQYQDMIKNITLEKEKMYKSFLLVAKNTIKDCLNIEFSSYRNTNGYSSSLKRINTIEPKTKDEILNDINNIRNAFNSSDSTDKNKVGIAIQILEEYYIVNN
ncbi:MAG: hypothetical protein PHE05_05305 [Bacilli bacterium]|nr:hypothetical protein [Bacilli bacterium]